MVVPALDLCIIHMGRMYWEMIERSDSIYGRMAELHGVWWLDVSAVFYGVPRGRYRIQWNLVLANSSPIMNTEFRAVSIDRSEVTLLVQITK